MLNKTKAEDGFLSRKIKYKTLFDLYDSPSIVDDLPFMKRKAFKDEKEYRVLYCSLDEKSKIKYIPLAQSDIEKIIINPWVTASVFESVKAVIKSIDGCAKIRVVKSTVVENEQWKMQGDEAIAINRTKRIKPIAA